VTRLKIRWQVETVPQGLKPDFIYDSYGTAEAVPFQSDILSKQ
jgi:hypothetical protein